MNDDTRSKASGKAVEQSYLQLQDAFREYRRWRDLGGGGPGDLEQPDIRLQDAILTFYELLRPYVRNNPSLKAYWEGAIVEYPQAQHEREADAIQYYLEHSHGIWQAQTHKWKLPTQTPTAQAVQPAGAATDGGHIEFSTLSEWHKELGLSDSVRILQLIDVGGEWVVVEGRFAVVGLRDLDSWRVYEHKTREVSDGFMASKSEIETVFKAEPNRKLETAARMLVEVADKLGVIAEYNTADSPVRNTPRAK